jgi:hypothetical protein
VRVHVVEALLVVLPVVEELVDGGAAARPRFLVTLGRSGFAEVPGHRRHRLQRREEEIDVAERLGAVEEDVVGVVHARIQHPVLVGVPLAEGELDAAHGPRPALL